MALSDPYATYTQYSDRTGLRGDARQDEIESAIVAASRLVERWTGRNFNQTAAATARYYDGNGDAELWVGDFVSLSAVAVDIDGDGTYSQSITAAGVLLRPYSAAAESWPYTSVELNTGRGAELYRWPALPRAVRLTGVHGWPAVPAAIVDATITVARQIDELLQSGLTLEIEAVDAQLKVRPGAFSLITALREEYSRRMPGVGAF